jgi:DNA-nicking Smr family endonuclease
MTREKTPSINRPFENLSVLVAARASLKSTVKEESKTRREAKPLKPAARTTAPVKSDPDQDALLFASWMAGVKPVFKGEHDPAEEDGESEDGPDEDLKRRRPREAGEDEARACLEELVAGGRGFVIAHTSEYVEGTGYGVPPAVARRLHEGGFSMQDHLDLHGFTGAGAEDAFNLFVKNALALGRRAVLVIHGRGLASPGEPVLKGKVISWLTRGPWRKWVIAFASARLCDGGAGAAYVLFRNRPVRGGRKKRWAGNQVLGMEGPGNPWSVCPAAQGVPRTPGRTQKARAPW